MTIVELRKQLGQELGYGSFFAPFDGTAAAYKELSDSEKIALTNKTKAYIREHPDAFTPIQQGIAQTPDIEVPTEYTWGEAASDFVGEMANQAEAINPLSEQNRGKTALAIVIIAAIAAGAYFYAKGSIGRAHPPTP